MSQAAVFREGGSSVIAEFTPIADRMPTHDGQSLVLEIRSMNRMTTVNVVKENGSTFNVVCRRLEKHRSYWVTVFQALGLGSPEAVEDIWSRLWACQALLP